jgi:hypothetical protein
MVVSTSLGVTSRSHLSESPLGVTLSEAKGAISGYVSFASLRMTGPGAGAGGGESAAGRPHPNSNRTDQTAKIIAAMSAISPAGTACRVFLILIAPKYTAMT